jgi:multidrug efflux pump subunit AcrA (membrane-fusion protein)
MNSVLDMLRKLKLWQMAVLGAVLVVGGGTVYAVANGGNGRLDENQQLVPVRLGDLVNQVSISGSVRFPNQAALGFGIQGTVGEVLVAEGDLVQAGQPLARLDPVTVTSLQKAHAQAQLNLEKAQADVDAAMAGAEEALDNYRQVFRKWFGAILSDEEVLQSPDAILASWGTDLEGLFGSGRFDDLNRWFWSEGPPPNDPHTPWNESTIYVWMNLHPGILLATCQTSGELPEGAVCVQKELETAWRNAKDALINPLTTTILQADLTLARAALDEATRRLESTTIVAPMTGMVTAVNVTAGGAVNANAVVVELMDLTVAEVDGRVDEIDVLSINVGTPAVIRLDALGGQTLQGIVSYISPSATEQQGVVRYPVRVRVDVPDGMQLRQGLTATAQVVLSGERGVLLVPLQAVQGTFLQPIVQVMNANQVEQRPVVLGADDGFWVAIREGVAEGEQVVMGGAATAAGAISPGGRGQFGAGQGQVQIPGLPGAGGSGIDPRQLEEFRRQFQQGGGAGQGGGRCGGGQ